MSQQVKSTFTLFSSEEQQASGVTGNVEIEIYIENIGDKWYFFPACPVLPQGLYNVSWVFLGPDDLVIDTITIDSPANVKCTGPEKLLPTSNWSARVENNRCEAIGEIHYNFSGTTAKGGFGRSNFKHDPTIAVTIDPPPGCDSPSGAKRGAREAGVAAERVEEG